MNVPIYVQEEVINEEKYFTRPWQILFETLLQNMQQSLSDEGFLIPSVTNAQMLEIQNGVDVNGTKIAIPGTVVFNTTVTNGATPPAANGQLYVLLQDGLFHAITNT